MYITINEAKEYLSISALTTDFDGFISGLITQTKDEIDSICGQCQTTTLKTDIRNGNGNTLLKLNEFPVSLLTISYRDDLLNSWTALDSSLYALISMNYNYYAYNDNGFSLGTQYKLDYTYGDSEAPKTVKQVNKEMVAVKFKESDVKLEGILGKSNINVDYMQYKANIQIKSEREK